MNLLLLPPRMAGKAKPCEFSEEHVHRKTFHAKYREIFCGLTVQRLAADGFICADVSKGEAR
jgi:hypothetical protein